MPRGSLFHNRSKRCTSIRYQTERPGSTRRRRYPGLLSHPLMFRPPTNSAHAAGSSRTTFFGQTPPGIAGTLHRAENIDEEAFITIRGENRFGPDGYS